MQLWYAPTSPFARKVRVAAHELSVPLDLVEVDPWTDPHLREMNPLAKVPTLVLSNGASLIESAAICEFLDHLAGPRLLPPPGAARWRALQLQGLCDGACAAAGRLYAEERRTLAHRSDTLIKRFLQAIDASLQALEEQTLAQDDLTIGEVSAAVLLGYLDFRWPHHVWAANRHQLSDWFSEISKRPSLQDTAHRPLRAG